MSASPILTLGYGAFGSVAQVITLGYLAGEAIVFDAARFELPALYDLEHPLQAAFAPASGFTALYDLEHHIAVEALP